MGTRYILLSVVMPLALGACDIAPSSADAGDAIADIGVEDAAGGPACGAAFVAIRVQFPGRAVERFCMPLERGQIGVSYEYGSYPPDPPRCVPMFSYAHSRVSTDVYLGIGGRGVPFSMGGETSIGVFFRGLRNASICRTEQECIFSTDTCRFVVRPGSVGDVVEARLVAPCVIRATHPTSPPLGEITLHDALVRGPIAVEGVFPGGAIRDASQDACP